MSTRTTRVVYDLVARDNASRVFARVGRSTNAVATAFQAGAVAAVGLGYNVLKASGDFEKAMNQVRAVTGATGKDFQDLRDQAKELGATTKFSATQAAEGMGFLAMAGFQTKDIMDAMPGVLDLASAGNMDLARSADIASNILTGYGFKASETARVVDVMAKTFTSTNTDLTQLGEAFKYAGPVAHAAGVKFEQAAAAIGLMGNAGIQASMAGTSLRGAITRLLAPTKQIQDRLNKLGVTVKDTHGNLLPLDDIIRQLEKSGANTGDMMTIFGQRAGPAMLALVDQGSGALVKLTEKLDHAGGTAKRIADIQMEGLQGQLVSLKSAWEGLMIEIGDLGVLNVATGAVTGLTDATRGFTKFVDSYGRPALDKLRTAFTDLVPIDKIKAGFAEAKGLVSDFLTGLGFGEEKAPAPTGIDKFPTTVLGRGTGAPHLGSGQTSAQSGPGAPLGAMPHFGVGQVAPTTGVQGPPLAPQPHGGSGMVAPLSTPQAEPPKSAAQKLGERIREALESGLSTLDWGKVGAAVGRGLGSAFQWLAANGAELTKKLGEALGSLDWVDVGKQFGKIALPTAIGFMNNLFEPLFHGEFWDKHFWDALLFVISAVPFGKIVGKLGGLLGKIPWGRIFGSIGSAFMKIPWGKIIPFGSKIAEATGGVLKAVGTWVGRVATGFGEAFARQFPRVAQWFKDQLLLLPVRLGDLGRLLVRKAGELITRMGGALTSHIPGMGNRFIRFIYKTFARFTLWQIGVNLAQSMLSGIGNALSSVGSWLKTHLVDPVINWVKSLFGIHSPSTVFIEIGAALVAGFKSGILGAAQAIGAWVWRTIGKPAVDAFLTAGSWLVDKGRALVGGFKNGVLAIAKGIGGWMRSNAISPATAPFAKAGSWLVDKGSSLISGLKSGISGALKGIGTWIKSNVVDPIVSAVKRFFGIKSPSTVFAGIGGHLVGGLIKGMASTNGTAIAKRIFGDMPSALAAIVSKGLVSISALPGKALSALGGLGSSALSALGLGDSTASGSAQQYAQLALKAKGWGPSEWPALKALWHNESGWNPNAVNPSSGAYGIPQALPAAHGHPYKLGDYVAQINWGLNYIKGRYGSPTSAWAFWQRQSPHWYDAGGLAHGVGYMAKNTIKPERVLSPRQTASFDRLVDLIGAGDIGGGNVEVRVFIGNEEIDRRVEVVAKPMIRQAQSEDRYRAKVGRRTG